MLLEIVYLDVRCLPYLVEKVLARVISRDAALQFSILMMLLHSLFFFSCGGYPPDYWRV